jgi:hypothetical protein
MNAIIDEQYMMAMRSETTPEVLNSLASSPCEKVRGAVAENPRTPLHSLKLLARDHSSEVRSCVAHNPSTPWSVVLDLAMDGDLDVRYSLAENPEAAWTILCFLSFDHNPYISQRAQKTMSTLKPEFNRGDQGGALSTVQELEAASKIYETLRTMLQQRGRLSRNHALRLRELILLDGRVSEAEQKIVETALDNQLLDDDALPIFADLIH